MSESERIRNRRAIEALRAGVPNRDAVLALGSTQPEIERKFLEQLQTTGSHPQGMLVKGGFGAGKSHLLEFLLQKALREKYVCSKVVISKETPFYDPAKLFRAAAEAALVPNRTGDALTEIMTRMDTNSQAYADFYHWVNNSPNLSQMFAATLFIYERMPGIHNGEVRNRITRFWSGDKINLSEIKKWLRELRERVTFNIVRVPPKELALQRFKFAAHLMVAAGYAGWLLFIDELELIGRYSILQRARSYAELVRLMGRLEDWQPSGFMSVCSITDDFVREVLEDRKDLEKVPGRLRSRGKEADLLWASQAEKGMQVIDREAMPLVSPDNSMLQAVYAKIKSIYADAYDWSPPDITGWEKMFADIMKPKIRLIVKLWITIWDHKRLNPNYEPNIKAVELKLGYLEDKDLQVSPEGESEE